mmetsp:Transcript_7832/g.26625  ORF Transcript_7832/g.26625 Transcript_7832/m.26625 type:complete len:225 (+) Transcript_7832:49-723(+)
MAAPAPGAPGPSAAPLHACEATSHARGHAQHDGRHPPGLAPPSVHRARATGAAGVCRRAVPAGEPQRARRPGGRRARAPAPRAREPRRPAARPGLRQRPRILPGGDRCATPAPLCGAPLAAPLHLQHARAEGGRRVPPRGGRWGHGRAPEAPRGVQLPPRLGRHQRTPGAAAPGRARCAPRGGPRPGRARGPCAGGALRGHQLLLLPQAPRRPRPAPHAPPASD